MNKMDEQMDKLSDHNRVDAARGVPLERPAKNKQALENQISEDTERLDEKIRKAGI